MNPGTIEVNENQAQSVSPRISMQQLVRVGPDGKPEVIRRIGINDTVQLLKGLSKKVYIIRL